jgi:hypothetical protein
MVHDNCRRQSRPEGDLTRLKLSHSEPFYRILVITNLGTSQVKVRRGYDRLTFPIHDRRSLAVVPAQPVNGSGQLLVKCFVTWFFSRHRKAYLHCAPEQNDSVGSS